MLINGYIIEKYNRMTNAYTCNRLAAEADVMGIDLKMIGIHDTYVRFHEIIHSGKPLDKRNFVINRYKLGKTKDLINALADRSYNSLEAYNQYINKYEQVKNLRSDKFLMPKYILGTSVLPYDEIAENLGTPFVAKGLNSSMGAEIALIEKEEDLRLLQKTYGLDKEWLFEEFISTSFGQDMRVFGIRGEVTACMKRRSQGDFRANFALGGSVEAYEITPDIKVIAKDIYMQTGLDFVGIDLLFGEKKLYFCEINVMPGIEGIETATGVNVARKIVETIKGDFE